MTAFTSLTAADMLAQAETAKTVADIDPIVTEFQRRLERFTVKSADKSEVYREKGIANRKANLDKATALRDALAPKRKAKPAKVAEKPADLENVAFADKFAKLSKKQRAAIIALLG